MPKAPPAISKNLGNSKGGVLLGQGRALGEGDIVLVKIEDLLLDKDNPRLGAKSTASKQEDVLDKIVEEFGVDDVLASIACNGYYEAEPIIGTRLSKGKDKGKIVIVEGNRRLSACLILNEDPRAVNQQRLIAEGQELLEKYKNEPPRELPVLIHEEGAESTSKLLPYLGVRHILGAKEWDSFAKAAWIHRVIKSKEISLETITEMIGDNNRTVSRLLEGYYFVRQLEDQGSFRPSQSQRRGRGSNTEYPFSWVYTALGQKSVRKFLGFSEADRIPRENPLNKSGIKSGEKLLTWMFGNKDAGISPLISDSREIPDLAEVIEDEKGIFYLSQGKTAREAKRAIQPLDDRIRAAFGEAILRTDEAQAAITEDGMTEELAVKFLKSASTLYKKARSVYKEMKSAGEAEDIDILGDE